MPRYYALQDFFATYFHQDWDLDDPTTLDVVRRYCRESNSEAVGRVVDDIRDLFGQKLDENELHSLVLREYSISYDPWGDELRMREWLHQVLDILLECLFKSGKR